MKRRYILLTLILIFTLGACTPTADEDKSKVEDKDVLDKVETKEEGEIVVDNGCKTNYEVFLDSTETINGLDLWNNSTLCENLEIEGHNISQIDTLENGILVTGDFYINSFTELVPSWNVLVEDSSKISILIAVGNSEGYSSYYTMGMWRDDYKSSFNNQEDDFAKVSVDTIIAKKDTIDRIKFRIVFAKGESDTVLKNLSITTKRQDDIKNYNENELNEKEITLSPRQQLSVPNIGNVICSPTSLSMVLNYYGHIDSPEIVAENVYDKGSSMYGNWSFNASYAGGFEDLFSRVEYSTDLSKLMDYINNDIPLVLSIKTTSKESLEGSIMAYPSGHLIVLTGFKQIDGEWFAIVNDPAEYDDALVRREYKLNQLLDAWRGYMYVVQDSEFE